MLAGESPRRALVEDKAEAALKKATLTLKDTVPPPDIRASQQRLEAISAKLNALVARPQKASGVRLKRMAVHMGLLVEALIVNMVASGLYELLKHHWAFLQTFTMHDTYEVSAEKKSFPIISPASPRTCRTQTMAFCRALIRLLTGCS